MFDKIRKYYQSDTVCYSPKYLHLDSKRRIKGQYYYDFAELIGLHGEVKMKDLSNKFGSEAREGYSRRGALKWLGRNFAGAGVAATMLTALPMGSAAHAGEAQAATLQTPIEMRDSMDEYSENPEIRGVGVYINLRKGSSISGEQIGEWVRNELGVKNVPVEYRFNQSRGTATDVTLYVRGVAFTVPMPRLPAKLPEIHKHYRDVWLLPETAALDTQPD